MRNLFYNTINQSGTLLSKSRSDVEIQNDVIYSIFKESGKDNITPFEMESGCRLKGYGWPITSIRRAFTDLTTEGKLEKLDGQEGRLKVQRPGGHGKANYAWRLKPKQTVSIQTKLF